jgi:YkoY family integral membrane protein
LIVLTFALFLSPLAAINIFGQTLEGSDLAVIGLLIVLEGVLSIDNALVLGLLAKRLPPEQRNRALFYGLAGAFVFRFTAILFASILLHLPFVKLLGGGYLVYIAVKHLFFESKEEDHEKIEFDAQGNPNLVDAESGGELTDSREAMEIKQRAPLDPLPPAKGKKYQASFWPTVLVIELTDVAFAVDSILAAIALVGSPPPGTPPGAFHPKLWVVIAGGLMGVILMRFAARMFITLLEKFPRFETAAYLLVIVIGFKLLVDWGCNPPSGAHFGWNAHETAHMYHAWLHANWPLGVSGEFTPETHLVDFHDWRRPEFSLFWLLMVASFCVGFLPKRKHK